MILATGEKVDGTISLETETEITLEIKVSSSITDERIIKKVDIKKIEKVSPEEIAYQGIKDFKTDPQSSFKSEIYNRMIGSLQNFKNIYPESTYLSGINELLMVLQEEKKRVDAGEIKFQGKWLDSAEAKKRKAQIGGQQQFDTMKYQVSCQDLSGALNSFDEIEKNYKGTRIYPDGIELAIQILNTLERQALNRVKINAYNQEQFKKSLSMTKPEDVPRLQAAEKQEENQAIAAMDQAKKIGAKWFPFIPRSAESMNAFLGAIPTELDRLKALPIQKMQSSINESDDAKMVFTSGKSAEALNRTNEALKAWPDNEEALSLKAQIEAMKQEPTPTTAGGAQGASLPKQPVATPTPEPIVSDDPPFYKTPRGALLITLGAVLVVGALSKKMKNQKNSEP